MVDEVRERRVAPLIGVRDVDRWLRFLGDAEAEHAKEPEFPPTLQALLPRWDVRDAAHRRLAVEARRDAAFCGRCAIGLATDEPVFRQAVDVSFEPVNDRVQFRWVRTTVCGRCARRDRKWWSEPCVVCGRQMYQYSDRAYAPTCCDRHRLAVNVSRRRVARRQVRSGRPETRCLACGTLLVARRLGTKWCTAACSMQAFRQRMAAQALQG